jgi:uncharacterized membrane protein (DUF373 family)
MSEEHREASKTERVGIRLLSAAEHVVFFAIGVLLFVVALVLLARTAANVLPMFDPNGHVIETATSLLDQILLVLMLVELAYTVVLSLRGAVLVAEPFLVVGLIAVIRRILVITVGEPRTANAARAASSATLWELGVLTGVVLVFVGSIVLLRTRRRTRAENHMLNSLE